MFFQCELWIVARQHGSRPAPENNNHFYPPHKKRRAAPEAAAETAKELNVTGAGRAEATAALRSAEVTFAQQALVQLFYAVRRVVVWNFVSTLPTSG